MGVAGASVFSNVLTEKSSIATNCSSISESPSNQTVSTTPSLAPSSNLLIQTLDNHRPSRFTSGIKLQ
ncbi:hypothetical protein PGT21_034245 [Puccinia graminis f. sp. tritici]|uniref:Uncharacterized protein n=1 Tax=Puccinia graminis f. sp. tritici TaxID=56615 RepID=A0A5B0MMQ2_PUCGR|nr:hypothetical protein PGT21_034245 [Puccinia graminis f. sp. tritici]